MPRRWQMFFEGFLSEWYTVDSWGPQKRTCKMFKHWLDVQYHLMVRDLAAKVPITDENWESPARPWPLRILCSLD